MMVKERKKNLVMSLRKKEEKKKATLNRTKINCNDIIPNPTQPNPIII